MNKNLGKGGFIKKQKNYHIQNGAQGKLDVLKMQTGVALIDSMLKSRTLSAVMVMGIALFAGFFYFLYKMAGA